MAKKLGPYNDIDVKMDKQAVVHSYTEILLREITGMNYLLVIT